MRAKFVNEEQNFERGLHPKQALGIGGINLAEERFRRRKELEDDWRFFLLTLLDGKTISAKMEKVKDKGKDIPWQWGNYTVEIDEWDQDEMDSPNIFLMTKDEDMYALHIDDNEIYIDNAR